MIRYISLLLFIGLAFWSCDSLCPDEPDPKYGTNYDDYSTYEGDDCYQSNTYTYYCYNGRYRSVTYTKVECCDSWEESEYTSSCIGQQQQNYLGNMTEFERKIFYETLK